MQPLTSTLSLRELTPAEAETPELLPPLLRDWQTPYLRADWCWIVEHRDHGPVTLIITAPVHGILLFWRILSTHDAPLNTLLCSLPQILQNVRKRGCLLYATFLQDAHPAEVKLARIIASTGGKLLPWKGVLAVNVLEDHARSGDLGDHRDRFAGSGGGLDGR